MRIAVFSGSPKGPNSVTLQYVRFLERQLPEHAFEILDVGRKAVHWQAHPAELREALEAGARADLILWAFPLFYYSAPAQMKQFIEMLFEVDARETFEGKYATILTTSVHFYDHAAHDYVHAVSEDLGMTVLRGHSAEMSDLLKPEGRRALLAFMRDALRTVERRLPVPRSFAPIEASPSALNLAAATPGPAREGPILLITDAETSDANLLAMTRRFLERLNAPVEVLNLHELDMRGGCTSCYRCAEDNRCSYADEFTRVFDERIGRARALIWAASLRDRFLSARWKMFWDRSFFRGHTPTFEGLQLSILLSGPLRQLATLREVLLAMAENAGANLVGIATDEDAPSAGAQLDALADRFGVAIDERLPPRITYLSAGARLIFRDLVYNLKFFFQADYRFYKRKRYFDYPYKKLGQRLFNDTVWTLTRIPSIRRGFYRVGAAKMVEPYRKAVEAALSES